MHTQNDGKPEKNNKTKAYSTPRAEAQAGPSRGPGPNWGCCRLAFYGFPFGFLAFWYAYALLGWKLILGWL